MPEIPQGFSFEETDSGYILRRNVAGEITELKMQPEESIGSRRPLTFGRIVGCHSTK